MQQLEWVHCSFPLLLLKWQLTRSTPPTGNSQRHWWPEQHQFSYLEAPELHGAGTASYFIFRVYSRHSVNTLQMKGENASPMDSLPRFCSMTTDFCPLHWANHFINVAFNNTGKTHQCKPTNTSRRIDLPMTTNCHPLCVQVVIRLTLL